MPSASTYISYAMIIVLIVVFYFLLIRPQKKQEKKDKAMRASLMNGDRVCTIGGIIGRVVSVTEETVTIETSANRARLKLYKWAIRTKITKDEQPIDEGDKKSSKEKEDK